MLVAGGADRRPPARDRAGARRTRPGPARARRRRCRARRRRRAASGSTASKPGTSGANGACLDLLRRRRQRAEGAPVEAAVEHDEAPARPALAGELDRRLVGLRAGVGRRTPCRRASAPRAARRAAPSARCRRGSRRAAAARPVLHGGDDARVAVAGVADRDPGQEVEVLAPVGVPQPHALPALELDVVARVVAGSARRSPRRAHLRADAGVGEQLEQQRVRHAAVDDVRVGDAAVDRVEAGAAASAASRRRPRPAPPRPRRPSSRRSPSPGRRGRAASPRRR